MNSFKAETMPAPLLEIGTQLWTDVIEHLRQQGAGVRESGAFLLGLKADHTRIVTRFVPYEELEADALNDDYVSLNATSFAKLWDLCRCEGLSVVADVHTHRVGANQSYSDRTNPMIALVGHIALIAPRFAQGTVLVRDLGMYVYEGNHKWAVYSGSCAVGLFRLTASAEGQR